MQQEARNTETHQRSWSNALRHQAVKFVSAGSLEPTLEQEDEEQKSTEDGSEPMTDNSPDHREDNPETPFFFDSQGQEVAHTGHPDPVLRPELLDFDDSSEDEVVFTGRRKNFKLVVIETNQQEIQEIVQPVAAEFSQTPCKLAVEPQDLPPLASNEDDAEDDDDDDDDGDDAEDDTDKPNWPPETDIDPVADYIANIDSDYYAEIIKETNTDLEGGIDVEKAATQLDLSAASPVGIQEVPTRSYPTNNQLDHPKVEGPADVLAQMNLDSDQGSGATSSETDQDDLDSDDDLEDFILLEDLATGHSKSGKKGARSGKLQFPSASAFADALDSDPYFGFDIMDFDRPSLRKKPKGKQAIPELMLSDSEFEIELQEAWQNDRRKKKLRKKEREELRAQGLLGRKGGNPDLKAKYSKEMNMEQFMTELRSFLLSPKHSLALPPMTKQRRKLIHELANALNLKSQSRGHGMDRFPVLNKTARTPGYTPKTISNVDDLLSGRKFNRRLFRSWGAEPPKSFKPKRSGGAATYMEGDVVGASAPEIGAGNRGRAMLEKMGWSTGTALGASNNKGILQPVAHVVKNSRTGLG
ncbi:hypothetical protein N7508_005668 [Penicillium antarcticum]|uniref:uncharacterized protein n=1 Tax=Penicillium antarcticum TaxID=416450 RepID=UPI0023A362E6|nr:uncharacterized protein N7508_005668 [Penicillium antarcticum]KAJ5306653.1 hypothetical protein N7508_005668 [Penicillium antarcticum]